MPVKISDQHLEERIDSERQHRGDATMAKTLGDLVRERLMELEIERRDVAQLEDDGAPAPVKANSPKNPAVSAAAQ